MKKRILFLVNGYGLGNSTRTHGIIQHLNNKYLIDVFVYGNSFEYFKQVSEIDNLFLGQSLEYGVKNGKIDFFENIKKVFKNVLSLYKNRQNIKKILKSGKYSLMVSDSDFSGFLLKNRPKMISINNSDVILKNSPKAKKKGAYLQFFMECLDSMYQYFVPDLIVSPFFESCNDRKKIRHTSFIIRKSFQNSDLKFKKHHILIMSGGARALNQNISLSWNHDFCDLSVLGDQIHVSGKVRREKKVLDTSHLISQSTILVINGGFSSISEGLAMARPMVVIPLKGHMEQRINALWLERNKMGKISSWENLENSLFYVMENYEFFRKNLLSYLNLNGGGGEKFIANIITRSIEDNTTEDRLIWS